MADNFSLIILGLAWLAQIYESVLAAASCEAPGRIPSKRSRLRRLFSWRHPSLQKDGAGIKPSFLNRYLKRVWRFSLAAIFGVSFYSAFLQYQVWKESPLARFFLPPYQNIAYFFSYVGWRIFAPWVAALLASIFISRVAVWLNKRFHNRFFEEEESRLLGLGIFLTGYPGFLFYLVFMLAVGILLSVFYSLFNKGRMPLYYWWLPLAIFVIIIKNWFLPASLLNLFIL